VIDVRNDREIADEFAIHEVGGTCSYDYPTGRRIGFSRKMSLKRKIAMRGIDHQDDSQATSLRADPGVSSGW
jgi:hypothetical protein